MKYKHNNKNIIKLVTNIFIIVLLLFIPAFLLASNLSIISFPTKIDTKQERINVQIVLNKVMIPSPGLVTDGIFWKKTIQAIKTFQVSQDLIPDGKVGPVTRAALENSQKNIASPVLDCPPGALFSSITGKPCTTSPSGEGNGGSTCSGFATQSCIIINGTGSQSRVCNSGTWSSYGACTLVSCNNGYQISGNTCISIISKNPNPSTTLQWGAYVGDGINDLSNFESLVGKEVNLYADFEGWSNSFPSSLSSKVGSKGKTLIIFWEPDFGYDNIINSSKDTYIKQFAISAKSYNYTVILSPFDEMNLNEEAWGYGKNNNTAEKFKTAWQHIHDLFISENATNVKFAISFNNVSVPDVAGNKMTDYYPGDNYVDYVGLDGFNFGNPWQTFAQVFDSAISNASVFNKPIYILSTTSIAGAQKATWITDGLGKTIKTYTNVIGWIWFNQGGNSNWLVNSDSASLAAFKAILP